MTDQTLLAALERRMDNLVLRHGWGIQGVIGDTPLGTFSYTVGLTDAGLPELWVGSLLAQGAEILNAVAAAAVAADTDLTGIVDAGFSVPFQIHGPCDVAAAEVLMATRRHPVGVRVLQVLWPDPAGLFPGDDGYDTDAFPQRVLPVVAS